MRYTAHVARSGAWWTIEFPDVDRRIHSQARRLEHVPPMAAEALTMWFADEDGRVVGPDDVDVITVLDGELDRLIARARDSREAAQGAAVEAAAATRAASLAAHEAGLPVRDIGDLLGVSHQYAARLVKQ